MQNLAEQMTSASRAQVAAQLEFLGTVAAATVDNAGKLALLQLDVARQAMDRSSAAWLQLLSAANPGDLASRMWPGMAGALNQAAPIPPAPPGEAATGASADQAEPPGTAPATAARQDLHQESAGQPQPEAAPWPAAEPDVARTPIAQAAAQVVPNGAGPQPEASPLPMEPEGEIELPRVKPLTAAPSPAAAEPSNRRRGPPRK